MASLVLQDHVEGGSSPIDKKSPARSCVQGLERGAARGRDRHAYSRHLGCVEVTWEPGSRATHREGCADAEGCPIVSHHMTLHSGTEVKLGGR